MAENDPQRALALAMGTQMAELKCDDGCEMNHTSSARSTCVPVRLCSDGRLCLA